MSAATSTDTPATNQSSIDAAPVAANPIVESIDKILKDYDELATSWKGVLEVVKNNLKETTAIKNALVRVRRDVDKGLRKKSKTTRRIADPNRPTGFKKPIEISTELAKFLKVEPGTKMSRTDVTKAINIYIKEHDLQNPLAKREFDLNKSPAGKALFKLLNPTGEAAVSYFNLQRWLAPHFPKPPPAETAAAPAAPADTPPVPPTPAGGARRRAPARKA
tara:strand:- start:53 stop:712 length:660 start_codon:yes stop_codon:yes gene_type:complete